MSAVLIRVAIFLTVLFLVGELLKRLRRKQIASSSSIFKVREQVALHTGCTMSAVEFADRTYVIVSNNNAVTLIDTLLRDVGKEAAPTKEISWT